MLIFQEFRTSASSSWYRSYFRALSDRMHELVGGIRPGQIICALRRI